LFEGQHGEFFSKDRYYIVPVTDTLWTYLYNMMFFGTLAWYLDNTLSQNRGVPKPWYFPLMISYWFPFLDNQTTKVTLDYILKNLKKNDTYNQEKNSIITAERESKRVKFFDGLRAIGLSKTYKSIDTTEIQALKNVYFEINKGELLGIMGHNGAGKSTLINVLCGLVSRDQGNARISDKNINDNLS